MSSNGNSGGIGLWWNELDVSVISFSSHHVLVAVLDDQENPSWYAAGVYGWPELGN